MMRGHVAHIEVIGSTVEVWYESMTGGSSDSIIDRHEFHSPERAQEVAKHIGAPYGKAFTTISSGSEVAFDSVW
jgi:hypothetical protein